MTLSPRQVRSLLDAHRLRPSRALGQNFVADANTVRRIARLADVHSGDAVVEVGAGLGSLSLALAETGARLVAIEVDDRLVPVLREQVEPLGVEVVHGDALTLEWEDFLRTRGAHRSPGVAASGERIPDTWHLVANLPYNVAVPVVARVLDDAPSVGSLLVMVQREVGERLAASPGSRAYGAVSVKVAYYATAKLVGSVPASVFVPRPRVESVLVQMSRRPAVAVDPERVPPERLFAVVRAGFAHRRKMLRGALAGVVGADAFTGAGIDPGRRAEELSVEEWGRLTAYQLGTADR